MKTKKLYIADFKKIARKFKEPVVDINELKIEYKGFSIKFEDNRFCSITGLVKFWHDDLMSAIEDVQMYIDYKQIINNEKDKNSF